MSQKSKAENSKPVFKYNHPAGFTKDVIFVVDTYNSNGNLYMGLVEAHTGEPFTDVTRNFGEPLGENTANIKNTNENEGMAQFLIENELGFIMGNFTEEYPLFFFDPFKLEEVDPGNQYGKK